jgi:hypothetical protein
MANLLESSQTQETKAPDFYNTYLGNLASKGTEAAANAQYIGAQDLQNKAFNMVDQNTGAFQAPVNQAQQIATQAAGTGALAAAQPYLQGASQSGGLQAAMPFLSRATQSPAELAQQYMNPFINSAVQNLSDISQRNIQNNLSPQATAAAVGSGQFGSQRGAQVAGQVAANANQDLNSQIAQLLSSGYGQALTAAGQQNQLFGTLGSTAGNLGQQQASNLANLGQIAGNLTAQEGQIKNTAANNLGTLGQTGQNISLADINALSTLGGQQQTIKQNEQLFPLSNLSTLSGLIRGYNIPTSSKTTATASPLSVAAGLGTGVAGLFQGTGTNGTGPNLISQISKYFTGNADEKNVTNPYFTPTGSTTSTPTTDQTDQTIET